MLSSDKDNLSVEENLCEEANLGKEKVQESVEESDLEMILEGVPIVSTPLEYGPHKKTYHGRSISKRLKL